MMSRQHYLLERLSCSLYGDNLLLRLLVIIVFMGLLLMARDASSAISYVQETGSFSGYFPSVVEIPVTNGVSPGNSVIVTISVSTFGVEPSVVCSDSKSNVYNSDLVVFDGATNAVAICSAHNVLALTTGDKITVSFSASPINVAAIAHEFSGLASLSPLDRTASASGNSTAPSSGNTDLTTQAEELLIGAIGTFSSTSPVFTPGVGYSALGTESSLTGSYPATIYPEYWVVSSTGTYRADGTLNTSHDWVAGVTTYKAAPSGTLITISGTLYSDEGTTPVSGETVHLVVEGGDAGTGVTDASGNYSVSAMINPSDESYIPLLVFVDGGAVVATTVTVMDSVNNTSTISNLDLYADHLVVRSDHGLPLDNGDIGAALGSYSSPGNILYNITYPDLVVTGASTELYIASGHTYTPGGNVTTTHMQIEGTLNAGVNVFTVNGNWKQGDATFSSDSSTVNFTGNGLIEIAGVHLWYSSSNRFYNVTAASAGYTTNFLYGISVNNNLTLGSGTLEGGEVLLLKDGGTPLITSGATLSNYGFKYSPLTNPVNIAATSYPLLWLSSSGPSITFTLQGDINCTKLWLMGNFGKESVLDTANHTITCDLLLVGFDSSPSRYGKLLLNNSTVNVGNLIIYPSDSGGANEIVAGGSTINVSGDWTNRDIYTANSSTVILSGTSQALNGSTTFYNLTKTVTAADTLLFEAGTTQNITGTATLNGSSGQLLSLHSAIPGTRWNFNLAAGAGKSISHVDVQDSDASGSDSSLLEINPPLSIDSGNNVSWFGSANITAVKSSTVISDPVNGTVNPKRIPGAVVEYHILVSNTSGAQATNLTITDDLSAELANLDFEVDGYAPGKGIQVTAPNINGGTVLDLTNAADADQGDYGVTAANTVTVGGIVLDAGEQAGIRFRVIIR